MTRLTPEMIHDVPYAMSDRDHALWGSLGRDLRGLAYEAVGLDANEHVMESLTIACVPVTAGQSTISGFSESVCAVAEHLGSRSYVTKRTDVAGFLDAIEAGADIVFMADDEEFVAFNVKAGRAVNNIRSTALGYFTALRLAAGPLDGKDVLLIGAGRVGSKAGDLLAASRARVTVVDADPSRTEAMLKSHRSFVSEDVLETAVRKASLIFNASPARIPGEWIKEGAIVVSPGMPFSFDEEGMRRMSVLVHDPLQIGVAVMAVWSASLSLQPAMAPHQAATVMEVIS
jgi:pyrrolysine biosynthesis protein PylD